VRGGVARRVVNATGVVLHTNLGRAPLGEDAARALTEVAGVYSAVEIDLVSARRGRRAEGVERLLRLATGAEAALAVNNNAGAVLLVVSALARGKEVIVSRGELVEIGGSFRIPDVMGWGGARLREVGTTNRTHLADYQAAIGPETAAIMVVHPSNFHITGFVGRPDLAEIAALSRAHDLLLVEDQGSGYLVDPRQLGLPERHTVRQSLEMGADLVTFSGDKILGGPQAGVIAGRERWIRELRADPLTRALRIDRLTIAALETTLRAYLNDSWRGLPVPTMLAATAADLARRAEGLRERLLQELGAADSGAGDALRVDTVESDSRVGGGAFPEASLPTTCVRLRMGSGARPGSVAALGQAMRLRAVPVVARLSDDALLLDPRTLLEGDEAEVVAAVADAGGRLHLA